MSEEKMAAEVATDHAVIKVKMARMVSKDVMEIQANPVRTVTAETGNPVHVEMTVRKVDGAIRGTVEKMVKMEIQVDAVIQERKVQMVIRERMARRDSPAVMVRNETQKLDNADSKAQKATKVSRVVMVMMVLMAVMEKMDHVDPLVIRARQARKDKKVIPVQKVIQVNVVSQACQVNKAKRETQARLVILE